MHPECDSAARATKGRLNAHLAMLGKAQMEWRQAEPDRPDPEE